MITRSVIRMAAALASLGAAASGAQPVFQDVTGTAGLGGTRVESWGVAIGDINGDRYPDIFQPNHRTRAKLWRNDGDGTFTEVSASADVSKIPGWKGGRANVDKHGPALGDYDNDGDQDLTWVVSQGVDAFARNDGTGRFTSIETTVWSGQILHGADRQPIFLDSNSDGRLDIFFASLTRSGIYRQTAAGTYGGTANLTEIACNSDGSFAHLVDVHPNPGLEVLCGPRNGLYPASVTSFSATGVPTNVGGIPQVDRVADVATADFDGNGFPDIVEVIGIQRFSDAAQISSTRVESQMIQSGTAIKNMTFKTTGVLNVYIDTELGNCTPQGCPARVDIGAGRYHPGAMTFSLDPANVANHGIATDGLDVNIGYNPATQTWTFESVGAEEKYTYFGVDSTAPISDLAFRGSSLGDAPARPVLLLNGGGTWTDASAASALTPNKCSSVAVGDFDNDMDEDIYFGCTGGAVNAPNLLYSNNGNGTFQLVVDAAGAAGATGPAYASGTGVGTTETVSLTDFDLDGFLDIFVSNGNNMRPLGYGGPNQYFRNLGNGNRWIELDLRGVASNRDAIGSVVRVTSGGKTQYREVNGGYHRYSQNFKRVHVGLSVNATADISVTWPNGAVQTYTNVAANGVYEAVQGGGITLVTNATDSDGDGLTDADELVRGTNPSDPDTDDGSVNDGAEVANGTNPLDPADDIGLNPNDFCGAPTITASLDRATFLWRDCAGSGVWHLMTVGGGTPTELVFTGTIAVAGGLTALTPVNIEATDVLDVTTDPNALRYSLRVYNTGRDGFDFQVGQNACFTPIGPALPVFAGAQRVQLPTPTANLTTGRGCTP